MGGKLESAVSGRWRCRYVLGSCLRGYGDAGSWRAISIREWAPSLARMCETWVCTVERDRNRAAAMSGLDCPAPTSSAILVSAAVSASQPVLGRRRAPRTPRRTPSGRSRASARMSPRRAQFGVGARGPAIGCPRGAGLAPLGVHDRGVFQRLGAEEGMVDLGENVGGGMQQQGRRSAGRGSAARRPPCRAAAAAARPVRARPGWPPAPPAGRPWPGPSDQVGSPQRAVFGGQVGEL